MKHPATRRPSSLRTLKVARAFTVSASSTLIPISRNSFTSFGSSRCIRRPVPNTQSSGFFCSMRRATRLSQVMSSRFETFQSSWEEGSSITAPCISVPLMMNPESWYDSTTVRAPPSSTVSENMFSRDMLRTPSAAAGRCAPIPCSCAKAQRAARLGSVPRSEARGSSPNTTRVCEPAPFFAAERTGAYDLTTPVVARHSANTLAPLPGRHTQRAASGSLAAERILCSDLIRGKLRGRPTERRSPQALL
mmetsp:Transcript_16663/g.40167  ORF Transcript_16663/g.40167 Transcript_16663/m.40167 type:complete len:249 (-) Transcript_16663:256-1002(-)